MNRGASEPPANVESVAFQMMQMSFHAGRQGQTGQILNNAPNGYATTPDNNRTGGLMAGSFVGSPPNLSSEFRTPQLNFGNETVVPYSGIVAKRQIQQSFGGRKVNLFYLIKFLFGR